MGKARTCWSCRGPAGRGLTCPTCEALQPPFFEDDFFVLLGVERGFVVDGARMEAHYQERQQQVHPDRFATRSPTERRLSMEHVTRLNEAYQTLRDPLSRGRYLLGLHGVLSESGGQDPSFLMEIMELREGLAAFNPRDAGAWERLNGLRQEAGAGIKAQEQALERAFSRTPPDLTEASRRIDRLSYYQRFLEEIDRQEERLY